jgi:hypothetical protein
VTPPGATLFRVVQWTTGNVGKQSVRAILADPRLELVGCYAWSPEKTGRDVGDLCGIDPIGVAATNDVDALLALAPDCVSYNPMWQDVDELVRILSAGVNVVSTAAFITGHSIGTGRDRIADACQQGGSTMFGSGISPGYLHLLAIMSTGICDRIDKISLSECGDATNYDSPETELPVGFGRPLGDPNLPEMTRNGTAVFEDGLRMIASALGVTLDEVRCEAAYAKTTADVVMDSWTIEAGCVAAITGTWSGIVDGRTVIEHSFLWKKGYTLEPDWPLGDTFLIEVHGRPTLRLTMQPHPPTEATLGPPVGLGMIMTAMPAINAIPVVVDARPGILTYADMALPAPRGVVS